MTREELFIVIKANLWFSPSIQMPSDDEIYKFVDSHLEKNKAKYQEKASKVLQILKDNKVIEEVHDNGDVEDEDRFVLVCCNTTTLTEEEYELMKEEFE